MATNGKVDSGLTLADRNVKFGLVAICDADGVVLREYKITAQEVADIHAGRQRIPSGCTSEEWENGKSFFGGWMIDEGQAVVRSDGALLAYVASDAKNGKIGPQLMLLAPEEFSVSATSIDVLPSTKTQLDLVRSSVGAI